LDERNNSVIMPPDDPDVRIWRYMDFTKFVSMLEHGGLFFPRADLLGDPFEGSHSRFTAVVREIHHGVFQTAGWPADVIESILNSWSEASQFYRRWTMISCWHMNEGESAAMWNIYAKSDKAIAIQSTYALLHDSLNNEVKIGVVHYIDYEKDDISDNDRLTPFLYKRRSFEYERELRAIILRLPDLKPDDQEVEKDILKPEPPTSGEWESLNLDQFVKRLCAPIAPTDPIWFRELKEKLGEVLKQPNRERARDMLKMEPSTPGEWKTVNLSQLIESIYVAPTASAWFQELVEQVVSRYGLKVPVTRSSLDDEPFF
jgi:hypothetical protein